MFVMEGDAPPREVSLHLAQEVLGCLSFAEHIQYIWRPRIALRERIAGFDLVTIVNKQFGSDADRDFLHPLAVCVRDFHREPPSTYSFTLESCDSAGICKERTLPGLAHFEQLDKLRQSGQYV